MKSEPSENMIGIKNANSYYGENELMQILYRAAK